MINALLCGCCSTEFARERKAGQTPFGLPVCEACANTFPQCVKCQAIMEPHQHGNPHDVCVLCGPNPNTTGRKWFGVKKHPSTIGLENLDRECAERIAREK